MEEGDIASIFGERPRTGASAENVSRVSTDRRALKRSIYCIYRRTKKKNGAQGMFVQSFAQTLVEELTE